MRASSSSGSRRFRPRARDLVSSAMNVENSREADPVRAEAATGRVRAVHINVALILSCIRARRAKRRMRQSTPGEVIVDWRPRVAWHETAAGNPRNRKGGPTWLQLIRFPKTKVLWFCCGPEK